MPNDLEDEIISTWKSGFHIGRVPVLRENRMPFLRNLRKTLEDHGFTEDQCKDSFMKQRIVRASVPQGWKNKTTWEAMVREEWEMVTCERWPKKMSEHDPSDIKVVMHKVSEAEGSAETPYVRMGKEIDQAALDAIPDAEVEFDHELMEKMGVKVKFDE